MDNLTRGEKDALVFHMFFTVLCIIILFFLSTIPIGIRLFALVVFYNTALPVTAFARGNDEWYKIWLFSFITSVFQVFPDWYLASQLDVLAFPEDGLFKIGAVSGYMAGLWAIPFFIIIYTAYRIKERVSEQAGIWTSAIVAFMLFVGSEQTMWLLQSWYARNVTMIGKVAIYIVLPEVLLGLTVYSAFLWARDKRPWLMVPAGFAVMLFYIGSSSFSYFMIEKVLK